METILLTIYVTCSALLILFGLHHYFVLWKFHRVKNNIPKLNAAELEHYKENGSPTPPVLTQIPLYNEVTVAERVIRAVAAIEYPNHRIQVLDDSNDATCNLVDEVVTELKDQGILIEVIRREDRSGYKAGALAYGLTLSDAKYVTIFDSDFVPPKDFLKRTIPHLEFNEERGLVQARWGHLNEADSHFTKAQSVGIDGHFVVEQVARSYNDYYLNFNGTAGVWRREAIDDAGGWIADTLTEDLDLSYRAQLKGWKFHYLPELVVPAEIPPSFQAFRSQQFRWAKGSMQTARKLLPAVWFSNAPLRKKIEATFHLTHYSIHLCMLIHAVLGLPIALSGKSPFEGLELSWYIGPMALAMIGPSLLYLSAELWISNKRWGHFFKNLPMLLFIGFGICLSNARACIEGLIGIKSPFVRTPKKGDGAVTYSVKQFWLPSFEILFALYTGLTAVLYFINGIPEVTPFFLIYAIGFGVFGTRSWLERLVK